MCSSSLNFSLFLVFMHLITSTAVQSPICFYNVGNFTNNSAYQAQLDFSISTIPAQNSLSHGFLNVSTVTNDSPNVMGLCRGDQRTEACRTCLYDSATYLRQICPNQKEAIVYEQNCTLRYTNSSLLGKVDLNITIDHGPYVMVYNTQNVSNPDSFNRNLLNLLTKLRSEAASSGLQRKFADGTTTADFSTIYAYVQCTPDLTEEQCSYCLDVIYSRMDQCCSGKTFGRIMTPSCTFRFQSSRFLDPVEPLASSTSSTPPATSASPPDIRLPPPDSNGSTNRIIILIVAPIIVAVIILIFLVIVFLKMKKKKKSSSFETICELRDVEYVQYDLAIIEAATSNFSKDNKLGQGGFGAVYKGKLPNGQLIAVKRLSRGSGQGEIEFKNEVILLIKLQHRNLVRLQGFCLEGNEKLLIYEFLENSSLDHFIFDPNKRELLDWDTRYKIIIGIARGLLYLHEDSRLRIIHRDLKASNILLDFEMNPKISDFGLAKLFILNQTEADTSRIVGTYGYMAPEYAMHGNFSIKSDVYSFGVLILEIVRGEKNNGFHKGEYVEHLPNFVWRNWTEGTLSKVIDPTLKSGSREEMTRCIHIGLLCVQQNVVARPTMASVVRMLNSDSTTVALPSQPACFMHNDTTLDKVSPQEHAFRESNLSNNAVSITELYPR